MEKQSAQVQSEGKPISISTMTMIYFHCKCSCEWANTEFETKTESVESFCSSFVNPIDGNQYVANTFLSLSIFQCFYRFVVHNKHVQQLHKRISSPYNSVWKEWWRRSQGRWRDGEKEKSAAFRKNRQQKYPHTHTHTQHIDNFDASTITNERCITFLRIFHKFSST